MLFWSTVGFVAWILCVLFMLAIVKGGHNVRGNKYERELYLRSVVNTQNRRKEDKAKGEEKTKRGRRGADRRIADRRSVEGSITEVAIIVKHLNQRRLGQNRLVQRRCVQRRDMDGSDWQESLSMN